jgi:hypothetical protein
VEDRSTGFIVCINIKCDGPVKDVFYYRETSFPTSLDLVPTKCVNNAFTPIDIPVDMKN